MRKDCLRRGPERRRRYARGGIGNKKLTAVANMGAYAIEPVSTAVERVTPLAVPEHVRPGTRFPEATSGTIASANWVLMWLRRCPLDLKIGAVRNVERKLAEWQL